MIENLKVKTLHKAVETPQVTVIIPAYNSAEWIEEAIQSVLFQSFASREIIVIDDGSTDELDQKLKKYSGQIRYLYQVHQGSASARNLGIQAAKGELISFLDADDFFLIPQKLEFQVRCFEKFEELGSLHTGWKVVDENNAPIYSVKPWENSPIINLENWLRWKPVRMSSMMVRRSWLEYVGNFDPKLKQSQDVDLMLRLSLEGCQSAWLPKITVCYRKHSRNTTSNIDEQSKYALQTLDKFFSNSTVPHYIKKIEEEIRYDTLVWLAYEQYKREKYHSMRLTLEESLIYFDNISKDPFMNWMDKFKRLSAEENEAFEIDRFSRALIPHSSK